MINIKKIFTSFILCTIVLQSVILVPQTHAQSDGLGVIGRATTRTQRITAATIKLSIATLSHGISTKNLIAAAKAAGFDLANPLKFLLNITVSSEGAANFLNFLQVYQHWLHTKNALATATKELADAQREVWDDILDVLEKILLETLKKRILDTMVDQIVNWIQGGGDPKFITNWQGFFGDIAQGVAGEFVKELGLGFLCSPFSLKVRLALLPVNRFAGKNFSCTLDQITGNIQNFYKDFRNGSWLALDTSWQPQNNFYGALWLGWDAQQNLIANSLFAKANEAVSSPGGFLSQKVCVDALGKKIDARREGRRGVKCSIVTPGSLLGDVVAKAAGVDIDSLITAKELSAYIAAIANALINRVIVGAAGLAGANVSPDTKGPQVYADIANEVDQTNRGSKDFTISKIPGAPQSSAVIDSIEGRLRDALDTLQEANSILIQSLQLKKNYLVLCPQSNAALQAFTNDVHQQQTVIDGKVKKFGSDLQALSKLSPTDVGKFVFAQTYSSPEYLAELDEPESLKTGAQKSQEQIQKHLTDFGERRSCK